MFKPRAMQRAILEYQAGKMGVAAVPGSGKTHTLSFLAAQLIASGNLKDDQEVLVVTLVNSAVENFSQRIHGFLLEKNLIPSMGYRVRTLHGLAHDIVRERPDLVGLSDQFSIIDEREATLLIKNLSTNWLKSNPGFMDSYSLPDSDQNQNRKLKEDWQKLVVSLATSFIRLSKDLQVTPADIKFRLDKLGIDSALIEMGNSIYSDYQRALNIRSAVDFDDLIRLALKALTIDPEFLQRLQYRWPYILEDEAQDSSRLQEMILRLLTNRYGNWVRVGDTNQAIYETFTTADPEFLKRFLKEPDVEEKNLANSGRSTPSIVSLANHLISWTKDAHPVPELRKSLVEPLIELSPKGDPQPNPPDNPRGIIFSSTDSTPEQEVTKVVRSISDWLSDHQDWTVAVLVPRNDRGSEVVAGLRQKGIPVLEHLQSTFSTRATTEILTRILDFFADPTFMGKLAAAYEKIYSHQVEKPEVLKMVNEDAAFLRKCKFIENYLAPNPGEDWLIENHTNSERLTRLTAFRSLIQKWLKATLLPIDQLILTISQDIFTDISDLALCHKLALLLDQSAQVHPEWGLPNFAAELDLIVKNERKFIGFTSDDTGFDPDEHRGKVVVSTIHKAKGLEWDRVYLLSVNNYDFPSAQKGDQYIGEKYFIRDHLNIEAEALADLKALFSDSPVDAFIEDGIATQEARLSYCSERLRLLYVGITRARKELLITYNTGRRNDCKPALPLVELRAFWEKTHAPA